MDKQELKKMLIENIENTSDYNMIEDLLAYLLAMKKNAIMHK